MWVFGFLKTEIRTQIFGSRHESSFDELSKAESERKLQLVSDYDTVVNLDFRHANFMISCSQVEFGTGKNALQ